MKLRNKKTGEIVEPIGITCMNGRTFVRFDDGKGIFKFEVRSLAEFNEEWKDYEEPKEYFYIYGDQVLTNDCDGVLEYRFKEVGNYFETKEEAEKAVEKLKAWKRLQDAGVTFHAKVIDCKWYLMPEANVEMITFKEAHELYKDIDLVFGVKYNEGDN